MSDACRHAHTIHQRHFGWDNAIAPVVTVAPGETVEFDPIDASGGQLTASSTVDDIGRLDFSRINPVNGPVYVDGAMPGDALQVTLLSFAPSGWGWTANIPGFGLLADHSPTRHCMSCGYEPRCPGVHLPPLAPIT